MKTTPDMLLADLVIIDTPAHHANLTPSLTKETLAEIINDNSKYLKFLKTRAKLCYFGKYKSVCGESAAYVTLTFSDGKELVIYDWGLINLSVGHGYSDNELLKLVGSQINKGEVVMDCRKNKTEDDKKVIISNGYKYLVPSLDI